MGADTRIVHLDAAKQATPKGMMLRLTAGQPAVRHFVLLHVLQQTAGGELVFAARVERRLERRFTESSENLSIAHAPRGVPVGTGFQEVGHQIIFVGARGRLFSAIRLAPREQLGVVVMQIH